LAELGVSFQSLGLFDDRPEGRQEGEESRKGGGRKEEKGGEKRREEKGGKRGGEGGERIGERRDRRRRSRKKEDEGREGILIQGNLSRGLPFLLLWDPFRLPDFLFGLFVIFVNDFPN
jgi:hypothetical protein